MNPIEINNQLVNQKDTSERNQKRFFLDTTIH